MYMENEINWQGYTKSFDFLVSVIFLDRGKSLAQSKCHLISSTTIWYILFVTGLEKNP